MCYPSDHNDRTFIPNWAMWYGVEMGEYLTRTGDRAFTDSARERLYALLAYFAPFENEYGLLEGLKSWVFVEWSKIQRTGSGCVLLLPICCMPTAGHLRTAVR